MIVSSRKILSKKDRDLGPPSGEEFGECLTPGEVAFIFKVDAKTVTRWAHDGKFPDDAIFRTLGKHRRFHYWAIVRLMRESEFPDPAAAIVAARKSYADMLRQKRADMMQQKWEALKNAAAAPKQRSATHDDKG